MLEKEIQRDDSRPLKVPLKSYTNTKEEKLRRFLLKVDQIWKAYNSRTRVTLRQRLSLFKSPKLDLKRQIIKSEDIIK